LELVDERLYTGGSVCHELAHLVLIDPLVD
jgi:hypothetical protein